MVSGRAARAFTLLEAILALAIIAAVIIVCLGLRSQALASSYRISTGHQAERIVQEVYESLVSGLLPDPEVDPDTGKRIWRGERLGHEYTLVGQITDVPNPVFGLSDTREFGDRVRIWRYELQCAGQTTEFYWRR